MKAAADLEGALEHLAGVVPQSILDARVVTDIAKAASGGRSAAAWRCPPGGRVEMGVLGSRDVACVAGGIAKGVATGVEPQATSFTQAPANRAPSTMSQPEW